jgi:hypothetical protein
LSTLTKDGKLEWVHGVTGPGDLTMEGSSLPLMAGSSLRELLPVTAKTTRSSSFLEELLVVDGLALALTLLVARVAGADDLHDPVTPDGAAVIALRLDAWIDSHELFSFPPASTLASDQTFLPGKRV